LFWLSCANFSLQAFISFSKFAVNADTQRIINNNNNYLSYLYVALFKFHDDHLLSLDNEINWLIDIESDQWTIKLMHLLAANDLVQHVETATHDERMRLNRIFEIEMKWN